MRNVLFLCLMLCLPGAARAEWMQASSAHFVVYADDSDKDIRRFSEKLERYHAAMAYVTGSAAKTAPSPSNRVTVYVVRSEREVRRLYGEGSKNIGGFYIARAGGSLAIVPQLTGSGQGDLDFSMIVLLHEYAHHFLLSTSAAPIPRWLSEGQAEFFASAKFESNGDVWIGRAAQHRAGELFYGRDVKAADLLDPAAYEKRRHESYDAFYGKSWLLYHYLTFDEARRGQLPKYHKLLNTGKSSRDAGIEAFGDSAILERNLESYLNKDRLLAIKIAASRLILGSIDVRQLRVGEAAMIPVIIRSRRGVDEKQAAALLIEARSIAARYPGDPAVLAALAEAEHDAGNDKEAIAAADGAIAADPKQVNAYVQKGLTLFRMAADADDPAAAYTMARAPFVALNKLENDHPLPLFYFYQSFVLQGKAPSVLAVQGLEWAVALAPFDQGQRMTLADQELRSGRLAAARMDLSPIAYSPHGGSMAKVAQRALARLDSDPTWDGRGGLAPFREADTEPEPAK